MGHCSHQSATILIVIRIMSGGIREASIPPQLGFGEKGISLRPTEHVPGKEQQGEVPANAELVYTLELLRVSIPPS